MIRGQRRADRAACVPSSRLHPDLLVDAFRQDLTVGHAVEGNAPGQAEILQAGLGADRAGETQHDLLGDHLDGSRNVHVEGGQQLLRLPHRLTEQLVEAAVRHGESRAVVEEALVDTKSAVGAKMLSRMVFTYFGSP